MVNRCAVCDAFVPDDIENFCADFCLPPLCSQGCAGLMADIESLERFTPLPPPA